MKLPFKRSKAGPARAKARGDARAKPSWAERQVHDILPLHLPDLPRPARPRAAGPAKAASVKRRRPRPHAPKRDRTKPQRGGLDALAWFLAAAVILVWPREQATAPPFDWRGFWPFGSKSEGPVTKTESETAEALEPGRGRAAEHPGQIPLRGWKDIVWRAWNDFNQDNIVQVAGGVAFFGLLALFPAMAAFVSLYGLFFDVATAQKQLSLLAGIMPAAALTLIGDQMVRIAATKHAGLGVAFVIGLLVSIWSANAGVKSMFVGLNIAFEEKEKRSFIKLNLVSLAFTLGAIVFLMIALSFVVVAPIVLAFVGFQWAGLSLLRWPLLFLGAVGALALVYRYGPSRQFERWRWISWGSTIAAVLWLLVSLLFSIYVTNFGHYDKTYGSLGAVIGFMSWVWISTIAVLFGAELNSEIEHQTAVDTTSGASRPMGARGAAMADTLGAARPRKGDKPPAPSEPVGKGSTTGR